MQFRSTAHWLEFRGRRQHKNSNYFLLKSRINSEQKIFSQKEMLNISHGPAVCRICMCGETSIPYYGNQAGEPLISPCKCTGTMGLYHRSCAEHWLTMKRTPICEICKFTFKVDHEVPSFGDYIRQKGYMKRKNNQRMRNPFIDLGFVICILPTAGTALALCINGATLAANKYRQAYQKQANLIEEKKRDTVLNETTMEFGVFAFITLIIFIALCTFIIITFVDHWVQFKKWQERNKICYLVDDKEDGITMPHYKSNSSRLSATLRRIRGLSEKPEIPEIVRSEAIPIEPIISIEPASISPEASYDVTFEISEDIPMTTMINTRELNEIHQIVSSTPQMYGLQPPKNLNLSPITLDDLYADSDVSVLNSTIVENSERIQKSQSVYSVCSFTNGVRICSTPRIPKNRNNSSDINLSSFRAFNPLDNSRIEEEPFETKGRFQVEKISTPTK